MKWYARSQRPLEMLIVSPLITGVIAKLTLPDLPVVDVGAPWHFWIVPAMPPQIWSRATFEVWKSRALRALVSAGPHMADKGTQDTHVFDVHFTLETVSWRTSSGAANAQRKSMESA